MPKTIIICITTISLLCSTAYEARSQAALFILIFGDKVASENFHLSLDIGLNASSMSSYDDGKALLGLNFGLGTHIKLNDDWFLAPEFKPVSRKGARDVANPIDLPEEFEGSETSSKIKLNYIEVPILLQRRLPSGLYFSAGPQLSFLSGANQETEVVLDNGTVVDVDQDLKDNFNNFNVSFPVEVGYALKDKREGKGMDLRLRYNYGLSEVFDDAMGFSANHSTFQFILTFPFVEPNDDTND